MFHPVGSQPPGVYWRRRLALVGTVLVVLLLLVVTAKVAFGGSGGTPAGQAPPTELSTAQRHPAPTSSARSSSHADPPGGAAQSSSTLPSVPSSSAAHRPASTSTSSDGPPGRCPLSQLAVRAVSDRTSYPIGATPKLMLQVTNTGSQGCVQDLADRQIELLVYNGASRVWGSHDCKVLPGVDDMTLVPNAPVRITVVWSGLSSQPGCAGTRQLVGPGTYTLYAKLSGKTGTTSQFAIH